MKRIFTILLIISANCLYAQLNNASLNQYLQKLGNDWISQEQLFINSSYTDKQTGITHTYFKQKLAKGEVYNTQSSIHTNSQGQIISQHLSLFKPVQVVSNIQLDAVAALNIALNEAEMPSKTFNKTGIALNNERFELVDKTVSSETIKGKAVYFIKENKLLTAWQIEVLNDETNDWFDMVIDANNGSILHKSNYTTKCNIAEMTASQVNKPYYFEPSPELIPTLNKADDKGTYRIFPLPLESPARGNRQLLSNQNDLKASPYGWHDVNGELGAEHTITRGNNVWAKEDTLARNALTGYSPEGGANLIFDYEYQLGGDPRLNLNAAITNLYYWNNIIHDIFYNYGFDEAAGNFQQTNYTKTGLGNDFVFADAQDGSGVNNANFSTPADGTNGRMQMYLWARGSSTKRVEINTINGLLGKYDAAISEFGGTLNRYPITAQAILVNGGGAKPTEGCTSPLVNAADINGKIALIDRGTCSFVTKVTAAQKAGAIAVIVFNSTAQNITPMTGTGTDSIIIPSVIMSQADGILIKRYLDSGIVTLSLYDSSTISKTSPTYDSDFDNGVIAHEYGHGISTRLTGGPANSSCLTNQEQAGEGWSDFFALALTATPNEISIASRGRGIGTHLINEDTNGLGIRPYKYTRDITMNPVTYNSIKTLSIPHGVGFVWCSVLYDIYLDMIEKYGFDENIYTGTGGNNKTLQLVVEGLKLQPCNPGFMDARNAILLADSLLNKNANKLLLWKAFARRGMGADASQGSASSRSDGTNGFKLPAELTISINGLVDAQLINVFPNPNNGVFRIDAPVNLSNGQFTLTDISGKQIPVSFNLVDDYAVDLSLVNISAGVYFLTINAAGSSIVKKVIVR